MDGALVPSESVEGGNAVLTTSLARVKATAASEGEVGSAGSGLSSWPSNHTEDAVLLEEALTGCLRTVGGLRVRPRRGDWQGELLSQRA